MRDTVYECSARLRLLPPDIIPPQRVLHFTRYAAYAFPTVITITDFCIPRVFIGAPSTAGTAAQPRQVQTEIGRHGKVAFIIEKAAAEPQPCQP